MKNVHSTHIASTIFSVQLTPCTRQTFADSCHHLLLQNEKISIATVNPEILLRAKKGKNFRAVLSMCTLKIIDGFGISFVSFFKHGVTLPRLTGSEAVEELILIAKKQSFVIGVVGGKQGRATSAVKHLSKKFPGVVFADLLDGQDCQVTDKGEFVSGDRYFREGIEKYKPNILLVALGALKQESFLLKELKASTSLKIAIGIGGLIDVWSGQIRRPPRFFSRFGIEWVWRLFQEPSRFTRILNAVIVFPIQAIFFDNTYE